MEAYRKLNMEVGTYEIMKLKYQSKFLENAIIIHILFERIINLVTNLASNTSLKLHSQHSLLETFAQFERN